MTEEEKKAAEAAKAEAEAKAKAEKEKAEADFEASLDGLSDEEKEAKRKEKLANDNKAFYEAELAKERKKREDAEAALAADRFKKAERKRKGEPEEDEDDEYDEDKPLKRKDLDRILAESQQKTSKEILMNRAREHAKTLTGSQAEAELVIEIFRNRTFPQGMPVEEQIEEAHAIANRHRIQSVNSELKRALGSKGNASNDAFPGHRDATPNASVKVAPDMEASLQRAGYTFDTNAKRWQKPLPNGKILVKDLKNKRTFVVDKK